MSFVSFGHGARVALLAVVVAGPAGAAPKAYDFTSFDVAGATQTYAFALNASRQIVGQYVDATGNHAFVGTAAALSALDPTGPIGRSASSAAYSINSAGDIAGAFRDAAHVAHGFLLTASGMQQIDYPGAVNTWAFGVNDAGTVIGIYTDTTGAQHAFLKTKKTLRNIDVTDSGITTPFSINNRGVVVGEYQENASVTGHGFIRTRTALSQFDFAAAPPDSSFLISINNRGVKLGAYLDAAGNQNNVLVAGTRQTPFDVPAGFLASYVSAQTINDRGDVVGYYLDAGGVGHGFLAARR